MFLVATVAALVILLADVYPTIVPSTLMTLALFMLCLPVVMAWRGKKSLHDEPSATRKPPKLTRIALASSLVLAAIFANQLDLPIRAAFNTWKSDFQELAEATKHQRDQDNQHASRIGIYYVDEARVDPRGGVYLRTGTSIDVIDTLSHGFAWKPNHQGSPFGGILRLEPLGDEWFIFTATDDFFP